jgi:hypothetical protein
MAPRGTVRALPELEFGPKMLMSFVFLLLVGCGEPPLALEENHPDISDAPVERDVVIYGTMDVVYSTREQNSQYYCSGEFDVLGWVEDDLDSTDVGCTGCSENYTIGTEFVDTDCANLRARGAPTVALMDFGFFPRDGSQAREDTYTYLTGETTPTGAAGPAERFGRSNWNAIAFYDDNALNGFFGVYPAADTPRVPADVDAPCVRERFLRATPASAVNSDLLARWSMTLCFTE